MATTKQEEGPPSPYTGGPLPEPKQKRRRYKRQPNTPESDAQNASSQAMDVEEYQDQFNWELGLKVKLQRNVPSLHQGKQTGGHLESREGQPYTLEEVRQRFGGGTYELFVSGPKQLGERSVALGRKQFHIAGDPRLDVLPIHVQSVSSGAPQQPLEDGVAPQAQASLVGILGKQLEKADESRTASGADPDLFREMKETVEASARSQVEAIKEASNKENESMRLRLEEMRLEAEKLRAETEALRFESQRSVDSARGESSSLIATLIPTFSDQSHQRAQHAQQEADSRVSRMQEQYTRDLKAADQRLQMQVESMRTLFEAQVLNGKTVYEGRIAQLESELALSRGRAEHFEAEARQMRDRVTELLIKQGEKSDPMKQIEQTAALKEALGVLGGGDGGGDGLSEDASDGMKMFHSMVQNLGPLASLAMNRIGGVPDPGAPGVPPMPPGEVAMQAPLSQHQLPPQPQPQMAPPPTAITRLPARRVPSQPKQPPQPKPSQAVRLRKKDLEAGVALINVAMQTGTTPVKVADTAAQTLDRSTLRELAKRKPQAVYDSLSESGILTGHLANPDGAAYLTEFLRALRARLSGSTYEPPAPPVPPQQEQEVAPEPEE